jgi:hypothetical protein
MTLHTSGDALQQQPWSIVRASLAATGGVEPHVLRFLQPTTRSFETGRKRTHGDLIDEGTVERMLAATTLDDTGSHWCRPSVGHPTFREGQSSCRGIAGSSRVIDLPRLHV